LFDYIDTDKSGEIDKHEFLEALLDGPKCDREDEPEAEHIFPENAEIKLSEKDKAMQAINEYIFHAPGQTHLVDTFSHKHVGTVRESVDKKQVDLNPAKFMRLFPPEKGGGHDRSIKENTRNPSEFFKGRSVAENIQAIREKIESKSSNDRDCRRNMVETFRKFDRNNDGGISRSELDQTLRTFFQLPLTEQQTADLFNHVDTDRSGEISRQEFVDCLFKKR
jgi:Ca2+-binding EF-hand superfamily protein